MRRRLAGGALILILLGCAGMPPRSPAAAEELQELLFTAKHGEKQDLYLVRPDGTGLRNLTKDGAGNAMGVWSPDGKRIAFISKRTGNAELFLMDLDGGNVKQLTTSPEQENQPFWSPDGKKIGFTRNTGDDIESFEIWTMDADGSNAVNLTNSPGFDGDPAWAPDGKQILFLSTRGGDDFRLYLMNPDGSNPHLFPVKGSFPAWSADGNQIAYGDKVDGATELFTCSADGTDRKKLTEMGGVNTFPAWSPDGKQLAFLHYDQQGSDGVLWTVSVDGKSQNRVAPAAGYFYGRPAWRPLPK